MTKDKKSRKSKKSTTKKRAYKISPLIPVIAVIEVIVLIVVSSYAWYYVEASKVIGSGTISVAADSGLDIDFQYSNVDDYINIWNYVGSDFTFEPGTSLDGRTIYFPTSGTFDKDNTADIVFRDGTVNDINSKYLSIDFELTNTSEYDQYVYLNNKSYFHVQNVNSTAYEESRALRIAFYQNDGNSGNVGSSMLQSGSSSDGGVIETTTSADAYTIYFENTNSSWGTTPSIYAYFYDSDDGSNPVFQTSWPGVQMSRVSGQTYAVTIENPSTGGTKVKYDKIIISNNGSNSQRVVYGSKLTTDDNGKKFNTSGTLSTYTEHTIYFVKPYAWNNVYCHTWHSNGSSTVSYTNWPGDEMTYVGSGIYAYSYDGTNTGGFLFDNGTQGGTNQTVDLSVGGGADGNLYYCTGTTGTGGKYTATQTSYTNLGYRTIYLFNTYGWDKPYATVTTTVGESVTTCDIAMTSLSGNMYYCTVPDTIYTQVYFRAKNQIDDSYRTRQVAIADQTVYRPKLSTDTDPTYYDNGHTYWDLKTFKYDKYIKSTGYPVISPGVSAGFQRPYSPVITIDAYTGAATEVVPAYSNSIDNYILGSGTPLFILKSNHMASLSMIMWLEGTDEACTGEAYAAKQIDLRLEFSTEYFPNGTENESVIVNPGDSNSYIYNFYDRTREIWTSDRQPTESGVTVAPVMQLYDNTTKRGYLMSPSKYASYNGKQKVSCWTVTAPQSIALKGHDIIFRRVNPYNEDEVWNYWHAGPVAGDGTASDSDLSIYSIAQSTTSTTNDTINFTAFADGSPLPTMSGVSGHDTDATYKVPDQSCGGLWGNHSVRTVTVYDGLPGQPLKDNNGVLTIRYNYQYKVGNTNARLAKIEYKASGPEYNSFYYFIVPNVAFATNAQCAIKRYTGFDAGYAINSAEKNPNITFVDYYGEDQYISGDYFELNQKTNGDDYSYWGSDMLYIQTNADTKNYVYTSGSSSDNNAKLLQVFFTANSDFSNRSSANNRFAYLYYNGNFSPTDNSGGSGFACVVPNDKEYTKFRVENCSYNGNTQYNVTDAVSISSASNVAFSDSCTNSTYNMKVKYLDENGMTLTYIGVSMYIQTTHQNIGEDPHCHVFDSNGNSPDTWPGYMMWYESTISGNLKKYYACDASHNKIVINVSKYNRVIFAYYNGNTQSQTYVMDMNGVHNDMVFESNGGNGNVGLVTSRSSSNNNTLRFSNNWTSPDWPHLTFQS